MTYLLSSLSGLSPSRAPFPLAATLVWCMGFILCAAVVEIMVKIGVLDQPGHRSSHTRPTPKGGGVGIIGAFVFCLPFEYVAYGYPVLNLHFTLFVAGVVLLAVVSWLDDIHSFAARYKLGAQFAAAILVTGAAGATFPQGVIFVLGAVFLTNALNFIDGINGLAAGVMLLTAVALASQGINAPAFVLFAACLAAFLPSNFPRARIFMGDVGSQAGAMVIAWGGMLDHGRATALVLLALNGVIWDVVFTLLRRARTGARLSEAHRGHLYQLAVRGGISVPVVTLTHWGFVVLGVGLALRWPLPLGITVLACVQCGWTALIVWRARTHVRGPW